MRLRRLTAAICWVAAAGACFAASPAWERRQWVSYPADSFAGAALDANGRIYLWGRSFATAGAGPGKLRPLVRRLHTPIGEGGAVADLDDDGKLDLVAIESGTPSKLVWFRAPRWERREIASPADAQDVMLTTLLGHRGVLLIHRGNQVRFYEPPRADGGGEWPSQDVYSFYTPSEQGGLLRAQIDADGREDLLAGNYWIRSPESFELPWRLFAINTWTEETLSARLKLAFGPLAAGLAPVLVAAQARMNPARLAWFDIAEDPRQQWPPHFLEAPGGLAFVQGVALADLDGDGRAEIVAATAAPDGRLLVYWQRKPREFAVEIVAKGIDARQLWVMPGSREIVVREPGGISGWRRR